MGTSDWNSVAAVAPHYALNYETVPLWSLRPSGDPVMC